MPTTGLSVQLDEAIQDRFVEATRFHQLFEILRLARCFTLLPSELG